MTSYKLEDLAREAGVSPRTVRYYVQRAVLPPPEFKGSQTTYGPAHLLRLRVVKKLQQEHLPLEAIASRLAGATVDDLQRILLAGGTSEPPRLASLPHTRGPYRQPPVEPFLPKIETWERIPLLPGVELHVLADASPIARRIAHEIRTAYGPFSSKAREEEE